MRRRWFLLLAACASAWAGEPGFPSTTGFVGLAVSLANPADGLFIDSILEGGTAGRAGILADQRETIVAVDGAPFNTPIDLPTAIARIRGPIGSTVELRLRQADDGKERNVRLVRRALPMWASNTMRFSAAELDALARLEEGLVPLLAAVQGARGELFTASFAVSGNRNEIPLKVQALANAELKLSLAEAEGVAGVVREFTMSAAKRDALVKSFSRYETPP